MDSNFLQRRVIRLIVRLQICGKIPRLIFLKCLFMKIHYELQGFLRVKFFFPDNAGIKIHWLPVTCDCKLQHIFLVFFENIFKLQIHMDFSIFLKKTVNLPIFHKTLHIHRTNLIRDAFNLVFIRLNRQRKRQVLLQRRDRITHRRAVHFCAVTMQFIDLYLISL